MSETCYNVDRHYTCADSRLPEGRTNSLANRVHPAEHSMSETCYNVDRQNLLGNLEVQEGVFL